MAKKIQSKPFFNSVDAKVNFPEMEKELLGHWYKSGVVKKYLSKNNSSKKTFSFVDGPITANNPMGVHHGWGRTYKDLWQRYKNMKGFRQRFQNGFDAQGLWVEVEVEKELGFKSKRDIERYGVSEFVQKCRGRVIKYSKIQTEQSKRLGYFMDWENSYYTMSDENNYMIWHFLKVCHENGWMYKGKDSVPWCPRCQTAISQHEMLTEDYKEVTHDSIYFTMSIKGKDEYLLVWTTTPWTLPANIAVAVDKKLDYILALVEGKKYWLAKKAADRVLGKGKYKILKTVKGEKLVGLGYDWAFDDLPAVKKASKEGKGFHSVIATDNKIMPIATEEGTGMVHTAVSAGSEDFKLGQKLGLPMIPVIADNADYLEGLGEFSGKNAKKHPEVVLDYLVKEDKKGKHWVFKIEKYKHRYPGCWRCKTELVWKVTDEWYIAMDKGKPTLRQRMIKVAKRINWIPDFGLKRELDWLNNMHDWLISKKNRYWGLALPVWECKKCGDFQVIGGKEELKEKAVSGWSEFEGKSPHKPQIDGIKIKCKKCGGMSERIEPVGNPWLDAGIVAYSTISEGNGGEPLYLSNKEKWREWFPADFITESFPGQFKNWFYSMIAMSSVLEDEEPYKTVLGFATLLGEDGRAMHKSWGNAVEFNEGADKIGVDVMRWMYARQDPKANLLFGYRVADEVRRQFHLKLWNTYKFFVTYANLSNWKPGKKVEIQNLGQLDAWLLMRLGETIKRVENSLEKYDAFSAASAIEGLVDDLSNWHVRRSRERMSLFNDNEEDRFIALRVLHEALVELTKLTAPFIPFMSDTIFKNLTKEESVHLADWPKARVKVDEKLLKEMTLAREVVEKGHSKRKEKEIPVRRPLLSLTSTSPVEFGEEVGDLVKDELNVLKLVQKKGEEIGAAFDLKDSPKLQVLEEKRKIIRQIQVERKKLGTELSEAVNVSLPDWPKEFEEEIKRKALVKTLKKGKFGVEKV